jgi:asparagine synthase (glutamine-hydrolysing)
MCGFVVTIGKPMEKKQIENALLSIQHRGPDDMGVWQDTAHHVSFGHARLSIIDLQGGVQPMTNHDQSLVAVVNGEFYGYQHIREELLKDGYRFKTQSDSEIILGLYERYGVRALKYLRGEFALVLWDKKNQLIFAARDYFGIKPLFFRQDQNGIYFASEAKAFNALGFPLTFDDESFYQTICLFPRPQETIFAGVKQIPPAHYLIQSTANQSQHLQSYWDFNYPKQGMAQNISEEDATLGLREVFREAVQLRLHADVPVGCYLSGGIDSCAVLGMAQHLSRKPVQAFTLTFDHEDYDEAKEAAEMAKMVNASFYPIAITQREIADGFENAVWHSERFLINGHAVAKYLLSRAVRDAGLKVVLTGEGSDEIFGGYAHFRQDQILYSDRWSDAEKARLLEYLRENNKVSGGLLLGSHESNDNQAAVNQIGFLPGFMRSFGQHSAHLEKLFTDDMTHQFGTRNIMLSPLNYLDISGQVDGRDVVSKSLYLWSKLVLPYYLLTVLGDRMEMAHSVEGRLPFLDHKLVEYVVSLPSHFKIKDVTEKYILRQAAKPFITKTIFERQKHPFLAPSASLSQKNNAMSMLINDTLRGQSLKEMPYIDQSKVVKLLDILPGLPTAQQAGLDTTLLSLLSACLLHKRMQKAVL